ncbi:MAG TPA: amidohydrolase family protein [Planctomycetota bacterium]|nr:amidohydrolase family protein [Planctomycetota bacterium]
MAAANPPRVDSHQHFWHYTPAEYGWIDAEMATLRRDFLPHDLLPLLQKSGIDGCIAVQARQHLDETRFLLGLADQAPWIRGVVGWIDLQAAGVATSLQEFARHPAFVGVRHVVQAEQDPDFLRRPDFLRGITALAAHDLVYELLVYPHQLPAVLEFVARFPHQRFVLDHLGKPCVKRGELQPWAEHVRAMARFPQVHCKLSGLVTEADWRTWTVAQLQPYVDVALEAFGPQHLMFGSDWPVCLLASSYDRWLEVLSKLLDGLATPDRQRVFGDNAQQVYRLRSAD